jgi:hypothetical protein
MEPTETKMMSFSIDPSEWTINEDGILFLKFHNGTVAINTRSCIDMPDPTKPLIMHLEFPLA